MLTKLFSFFIISIIAQVSAVSAFQPKETSRYFNGPTVMSVTATTAVFSIAGQVMQDLSTEEKQGIYFEYNETQKVCIAIYPTPVSCLPFKTTLGSTTVMVLDLKPNTSYTVVYKKDNTIRCITTPCPENGFESLSVSFVTKKENGTSSNKQISRNLKLGERGELVRLLQSILIEQGYLHSEATGYFGALTFRAVKAYQRAYHISQTGFVGPMTRDSFLHDTPTVAIELFEGKITGYSTGCFVDGECSISVDGKKVITTLGRSQDVVGSLIGISSIGDVENYIGRRVKVYARKTNGIYTLYGDSQYYIEIFPSSNSSN
jgi:hypothetical protein